MGHLFFRELIPQNYYPLQNFLTPFLSKNYSDGQHTDPEPVKSPTPSLIAVEIIYEEKLKPQS